LRSIHFNQILLSAALVRKLNSTPRVTGRSTKAKGLQDAGLIGRCHEYRRKIGKIFAEVIFAQDKRCTLSFPVRELTWKEDI